MNSKSNFKINNQGFSFIFFEKFQVFLCTWSLERCLRMWFYELTGVFVGFDVADPIEELKLSLMRLWRYTGNFSGHTNSEREEEDGARGAPPRVWKRKRDLYSEISSAFTRNWWLPMNISWSEGLCSWVLRSLPLGLLCAHCMLHRPNLLLF